jgi:hypothetical protein
LTQLGVCFRKAAPASHTTDGASGSVQVLTIAE